MNPLRISRTIVCLATLAAGVPAAYGADFRYTRIGNATDAAAASPRAGFALMGGGDDLDEAFRWLCDCAGGGDFLVLRAGGNDEYNAYVHKLCPQLNSVATLLIPSREAASDPEVARKIDHASALFISGGDQAKYINFWMRTPVQAALNQAIQRGIPIGGTSAGLAVMGHWAYSAQADQPGDPNLDSKTALNKPFRNPRITLVPKFLEIPMLQNIITDTHFARRDRMGRLLVFLAELNESDCKLLPSSAPTVRGLGVDERAAVLLDADGRARVIGGNAYFIDGYDADGPRCNGKPLTFGPFKVQRVAPGLAFDVRTWTGNGISYTLTVKNGDVRSTQAGGSIY